jgi:peptidoglycan/LPS O-acetylase OafA/YrhL
LSESHRIPALDGLRGLAILLVIPHNADIYPAIKNWAFPFAMLAHAGWIGVQLFFVLSGFLITSALLESRGSQNYYRVFYARRVLRIFPLYFLVLIVFLLILPRIVQLDPEILRSYSQQTWLWLFLSNWTQPFHGTVTWFPHFWSLAVEEQFYLVWPLVIAVVPARHILATTLVVAGVAIASRIVLRSAGVGSEAIYMFTTTRMDALALGAVTAVLARRATALALFRRRQTAMTWLAFALVAVSASISHFFDTHDPGTILLGYTLLATAAAIVVLTLRAGMDSGTLLERISSFALLRSCGKYSYAMYVFHLPLVLLAGPTLMRALGATASLRPVLYSLSIIVASYALGWLSYRLYERHFLALKRYFVPQCDGVRPEYPHKEGS